MESDRESQLLECEGCKRRTRTEGNYICDACWNVLAKERRRQPKCKHGHPVGNYCAMCNTEPKLPAGQGNPCCCDDGMGPKCSDASECLYDSAEKLDLRSESQFAPCKHGVPCEVPGVLCPHCDVGVPESPLPTTDAGRTNWALALSEVTAERDSLKAAWAELDEHYDTEVCPRVQCQGALRRWKAERDALRAFLNEIRDECDCDGGDPGRPHCCVYHRLERHYDRTI